MEAMGDLKSPEQECSCGFESRSRYKLRNSQIDSYIELLVRIQHLPQWQIGEIGLRGRLVIYFHFYLFVGILFLDFNFRSIAKSV